MAVRWLTGQGPPWFPDDLEPDDQGLVAVGGDLSLDRLLEAYTKGLFPWTGRYPIPWFSPDPRLILRPDAFRASHSLAKKARSGKLQVQFDTAFTEVMVQCATVARRGQSGRSWITLNMVRAYTLLHRRGVAHSVETWRGEELVGGLYGLAIGRAFFGESMFAVHPDASKLALRALCGRLGELGFAFVDCQQVTPHLVSLGAEEISRADYLAMLAEAVAVPNAWPARPPP